MLRFTLAALLTFTSACVVADSGRSDYDTDNDGLIEINDWADLDEIRNNLDGTTLYGVDTGCPAEGCVGFELTTDLDFDTNGDGDLSSDDIYWNAGKGWIALGTETAPFTAVFDGGGHQIRNLMIKRRSEDYQGLFGYIQDSAISHLGLAGSQMSIEGKSRVGGLAGAAERSTIFGCYASGPIVSQPHDVSHVGGLVGSAVGGSIIASFTGGAISALTEYDHAGGIVGSGDGLALISVYSTATVSGGRRVGGLAGSLDRESSVSNSYATGFVDANSMSGGLIGGSNGASNAPAVTASYWASDTTGHDESFGGGEAHPLEVLKCPTMAMDEGCADGLFADWGEAGESGGYSWDFGNAHELPALRLESGVHRDSDGDGYLDAADAYPGEYAAALDSDSDGAPDQWSLGCNQSCRNASALQLDQFPYEAAAIVDLDLDGFPDEWHPACDEDCQVESGLLLDTYLNDTDNDGSPNGEDINYHGAVHVDVDGDGLIDVATLSELNAISLSLDGKGQRLVYTDEPDSTGCPIHVVDGILQQACWGYELVTDLDFDTNGDGVLNGSDEYWNGGSGWSGIGVSMREFEGVFEGNGYEIRNLMVNRSSSSSVGLFGETRNAVIRNFGLTGPLTSLKGGEYVGGVVGHARESFVEAVYFTGRVTSESEFGHAGGLVGLARDSAITASFSAGSVSGSSPLSWVGGITGTAVDTQIHSVFSTATVAAGTAGGISGSLQSSSISRAYATGFISGTSQSGPIVPSDSAHLQSTYWASDTTGTELTESGTGVVLSDLRCPTQADDRSCSGYTLYEGWGDHRDSGGKPYWDFGDATQLPGLQLNGVVFRDSDGDGVLDGDDAYPSLYAAAHDSDGDGAPDQWSLGCNTACQDTSGLTLDHLPANAAAVVDLDLDGLPDEWSSDCDEFCRSASGLALDEFPDDSDNDGILNGDDPDHGGVANVDSDSDGLIEVSSLEMLDHIRYNVSGRALQTSEGGEALSSGCPIRVVDGLLQRACWGYELTGDLDFDTNGDGLVDASDTLWNDGEGWVPIGVYYAPFTATFNGNGYEIRNLMINRPSSSYQGLFAYTRGATIIGLGLTGSNFSITARSNVGGIAASMDGGMIARSYATGAMTVAISSTRYGVVGGLVGYAKGARIQESFSGSSILAPEAGLAGGILGWGRDATLSRLYSSAIIEAKEGFGRIAGELADSFIEDSLATGSVVNAAVGGNLIGWANGSTFKSNYWFSNSAGVTSSQGISVSLSALRCPTGPDNPTCTHSPLYVGWGDAPGSPVEWDFGSAYQLPALTWNGVIYRDSDGDGILDESDDDRDGDGVPNVTDLFPDTYAYSSDEDGDGAPDAWEDECDTICRAVSQILPDSFPLDAAVSVDSDGDGYPDSWNAGCDEACQEVSSRRLDDLPDVFAAYADSDGDGSPDFWNDACDAACQNASGLWSDSFPMNAAASADMDGDGLPDHWSQDCGTICQENSGLTIDPLPGDRDNDGAPDSVDTDYASDNGHPELYSVPEDLRLPATGSTTSVHLQRDELVAYDAVDTSLAFAVSHNGVVLNLDEEDRVDLPTGTSELAWVAIDSAGNRSEPVIQQVKIYPKVRFAVQEHTTGEASEAAVPISLSGVSPAYPVTIKISWIKGESTASAEDIDTDAGASIDLDDLSVEYSAGQEPGTVVLKIPIIDDNVSEDDEIMVFRLASAATSEADPFDLPLDEEYRQFTLTITETNLAPDVSLQMVQNGEETTSIDTDAGDVTVSALVSDRNGNDTHSYVWDAGSLPVTPVDQPSFTFDPLWMEPGNYSLSVTVTDDGDPALTSEGELQFEVYELSSSSSSSGSTSSSTSSGSSSSGGMDSGSGSGGGGSADMRFLLMCLLLMLVRIRRLVITVRLRDG